MFGARVLESCPKQREYNPPSNAIHQSQPQFRGTLPSPILSGDNSLSPLNLRLESSLRPPPVCDSHTPSCADNGSPAIADQSAIHFLTARLFSDTDVER
jgi:hypothetical protein